MDKKTDISKRTEKNITIDLEEGLTCSSSTYMMKSHHIIQEFRSINNEVDEIAKRTTKYLESLYEIGKNLLRQLDNNNLVPLNVLNSQTRIGDIFYCKSYKDSAVLLAIQDDPTIIVRDDDNAWYFHNSGALYIWHSKQGGHMPWTSISKRVGPQAESRHYGPGHVLDLGGGYSNQPPKSPNLSTGLEAWLCGSFDEGKGMILGSI